MESPPNRLKRLRYLVSIIVHHRPEKSFSSLIEENKELFHGFKVIYSTDNFETNFLSGSLKDIENKCPVLKKYFYGSGILFYSDESYKTILAKGKYEIPIEYSLSLDSNIAERFRVWENGGNLAQDEEKFENLIRFIKENNFNFDYSFFIIENLKTAMKEENQRPYNTIRALKRFDSYQFDNLDFNLKNPKFNENRESSGKKAAEILYRFSSSEEVLLKLEHQKTLYLMMLKAVIIQQNSKINLNQKLSELMKYSIKAIGKFPKTEIYFGWKLFKYGSRFRFFDPISNLNEKSLSKIKGMSWDLFSQRHQETLASKSFTSEFYIPFFASFDNRLIELSKASPIRALIIDERDKRVISVYQDELEFQEDMHQVNEVELKKSLNSNQQIFERMSNKYLSHLLDDNISILEDQIKKYYQS